MAKFSKLFYFFISLIFFIIFDVYFSNMIIKNLNNFSDNSIVDFIYVQNTGAAFSILQDARWFLVSFALFATIWLITYLIKNINKVSVMSLFWTSILIAGILCNMGERIYFGYVRDFFKLNFINFPVFNISDIFINLSVFAIVVIIVKYNYTKNNNENNN